MKKLIIIFIILMPLLSYSSDTTYVIIPTDTSCVVKNIELSNQNRRLKTRNVVTTFIGGGGLIGDIVLVVTLLRK